MIYNMTIEQIKSLLSRFYEGQTTPDEERLLADFFNMSKAHVASLGGDESGEQAHTRLVQDFHREDVPEELQEDKQLFLMLAQISDQEMPTDIAEEITAFVNNLSEDVVSSSSNGDYSSRDRRRCVISSTNIHN